jgi:ABC-type phosphate transport system permease subunit
MNVAGGDANANAAALVLLIVLLIINLLIFAIVDRQPNWIRSANH